MKTALGWLGLVTMGTLLIAGTTGCEVACTENEEKQGTTCVAKSLTRYTGQEFTQEAAWQSGGKVDVSGIFGNVRVVAGDATDKVVVTFLPFSYRAHDQEEDAVRDMNEALKTEVVSDGQNGVIVRAFREGTHGSSLGAQMTVYLPAGFDAQLVVNNDGDGNVSTAEDFDVEIDSVVGATLLEVSAGSDLSECHVQGAPSVTSSKVHCGDFVELYNVSDFVEVTTDDTNVLDDAIIVSLASISANGGGSITSADGSIHVTLPVTGVYSVQAQSADDGMVNINGQPAECSIVESDPPDARSRTLACGSGGPNYTVTAGTSTLGDGDVHLSFQ